ncbi:MAG: TraR/DksA C4-type zinc finger protein [Firmicutes bacterium]|nr:TraR/DksA C4-type zinc finger protein [Bacillota bacterium]
MVNIEHIKQKLLQHGQNIENAIKTMNENRTADQEPNYPTELSNYDNHPADIGTELYMVELNNALMVHQEHLLEEVRNALKKIDEGTYGICEICGENIDEERLEVIPYARLCLECEEEKRPDPEIIRNMRPNEELVIDAPLGRKYLNKQEDDEHEGMDILNDLMKYGSSDTPQDMGGYHDYKDFYTNKTDKQGIVDKMDNVSNKEYEKQIED